MRRFRFSLDLCGHFDIISEPPIRCEARGDGNTTQNMSNRPHQNDEIQKLREELRQKDQIIDRLTRMLQKPEGAPSSQRAVNDEGVIPIDIAKYRNRR
jgi:hypothetical protein